MCRTNYIRELKENILISNKNNGEDKVKRVALPLLCSLAQMMVQHIFMTSLQMGKAPVYPRLYLSLNAFTAAKIN
jgi:hypothetical protein